MCNTLGLVCPSTGIVFFGVTFLHSNIFIAVFFFWSQIKQEDPLNLSILLSGGKETNQDFPRNGEWNGNSSQWESACRIVVFQHYGPGQVPWNWAAERVRLPFAGPFELGGASSFVWDCRTNGGKFHRRLNTGGRPIAHKYREGKMQRTLKRELKSTWNCWNGSEGNQCFVGSYFPSHLWFGRCEPACVWVDWSLWKSAVRVDVCC